MIRNSDVAFFRCLPPEIRLQIYALVLGSQNIRIGYLYERHTWKYVGKIGAKRGFSIDKERYHTGGSLYHGKAHCSDPSLDLRLLRTCRQIYTETALLPYSLNTFTFLDDAVRRRFEQSARPGKKRAQKKAVGKYEISVWADIREEEWKRQALP